MELGGERNLEPGETLAEAENEIGMSDFIDAETGGPAEEGVPRLQDHSGPPRGRRPSPAGCRFPRGPTSRARRTQIPAPPRHAEPPCRCITPTSPPCSRRSPISWNW